MTSNTRAGGSSTWAHRAYRTVVAGLLVLAWSLLASTTAYAVVGVRAFGEVESALSAERAAHDRERILTQTLGDSHRALGLAQTSFTIGSIDLRTVEQRQLALAATRSALIRVQAEQRVQRVNLHLALGGRFEVGPPPPNAPPPSPAGSGQ